MKLRIIAMCCTHGRFKCLQRSIRCYLDQDYNGPSIMYIFNSGDNFKLSPELYPSTLPENKQIIIDNCKYRNFKSVGEKYQYALSQVIKFHPDVITSWDDDDIFLPQHLNEGNKGMLKAYDKKMLAYKPAKCYFRSLETIIRNENTYEPSIFVDAKHLQNQGYAPVSVKYHQQWLDPLVKDNLIFVNPDGISTLIYNWGDAGWNEYKLSGSGRDDEVNFIQHSRNSTDMGNGIITPAIDNSSYYNEIKLVS